MRQRSGEAQMQVEPHSSARPTKKLVLGDAPPLVASAPSPVHHPEPASSYMRNLSLQSSLVVPNRHQLCVLASPVGSLPRSNTAITTLPDTHMPDLCSLDVDIDIQSLRLRLNS
jgi:hypothetical protein